VAKYPHKVYETTEEYNGWARALSLPDGVRGYREIHMTKWKKPRKWQVKFCPPGRNPKMKFDNESVFPRIILGYDYGRCKLHSYRLSPDNRELSPKPRFGDVVKFYF
jgi:hypothetical protein